MIWFVWFKAEIYLIWINFLFGSNILCLNQTHFIQFKWIISFNQWKSLKQIIFFDSIRSFLWVYITILRESSLLYKFLDRLLYKVFQEVIGIIMKDTAMMFRSEKIFLTSLQIIYFNHLLNANSNIIFFISTD